jgi:hypothetical protein
MSTTRPEDDPMSQPDVRRCPSCGALVTRDAEWCGQCLTVLAELARSAPDAAEVRRPGPSGNGAAPDGVTLGTPAPPGIGAPAPAAVAPTGLRHPIETDRAKAEGPSWTCPACGEGNPLSLDECTVCGTPFKALFRGEERAVDLDPRSATTSSLLLPGLGHIRLGRVAEGVARLVLFAWAMATAAMVVLSAPAEGLGPLGLLAAMFVAAALVVYVLSAVDARRAAEGAEPVLSTRALLYGSAGLVLLSMASLGVLVLRVVNAPGS